MNVEDIEIDIEGMKSALYFLLASILKNTDYKNHEDIINKFSLTYENRLKKFIEKDKTKVDQYYRLITEFKPSLATYLEPGIEFDKICDQAVSYFNVVLDRVRAQMNDESIKFVKKEPYLPGTNVSTDIKYFCNICQQDFDIPNDEKKSLLDSSDDQELPLHHGQKVVIKIIKKELTPTTNQKKPEIKVYPAELLMGHMRSSGNYDTTPEYLRVLSVGIDIGSSTSHLVFSQLTLKRERSFFNITNRYMLESRDIKYSSDIIITPLIDRFTIDIEKIITFIENEYKKARISKNDVETGAVIITGETAKKRNALEIVNRISSETGKFVSSTAGPNFEATLSAMGSGIVDFSRLTNRTIMNIDVGGGSSKLAICSKGMIMSTSSISVGGRLLGIDRSFRIWKIDDPAEFVLKELGMNYIIGDVISEKDVIKISKEFARILFEVMKGKAMTKNAKKLMMTDDLDFSVRIDGYSFSGGISEYIYGLTNEKFNDIGYFLAEEIKALIKNSTIEIIEPKNKIRATVIGAGAFSLSISGSTCYVDKTIRLPLLNIPVLPIDVTDDTFSDEKVLIEINKAFKRFDVQEGEEPVGLFFKRPIYSFDKLLIQFAKIIEKSLINSIKNGLPIILLFEMDLARMLGLTIARETAIQKIICLDELNLQAGDWIDIGSAIKSGDAYPVTIKSLVFKTK